MASDREAVVVSGRFSSVLVTLNLSMVRNIPAFFFEHKCKDVQTASADCSAEKRYIF